MKHKKILSATKEQADEFRLQLPSLAISILIKCHQKSLSAEVRNELRDEFFWRCDWLLDGEILDGANILPTMPDYEPRAGFDFHKSYKKWMEHLKAEFDIFLAKDMSYDQWHEKYGPGTRWSETYAEKVKRVNEGIVDLDRVFREQDCAARFVALSAEQVNLHKKAASIFKDKDLYNTSVAMSNAAKPRRRRKLYDEVFWEAEDKVWDNGWPGRNALADICKCSTKVVDKVIETSTLLKAARAGVPRKDWRRTKRRSLSYIEKHKKIAKSCIEKDIARGKITRKDTKTILSHIDELTIDSAAIVDTWLVPRNKSYLKAEKTRDYTYNWIDDTSDIVSDRAKDNRR